MDGDRLDRKPRDSRRRALSPLRILSRGPDLAPIRTDVGRAVHGLHRGVGKQWSLVRRFDLPGGLAKRGCDIAIIPGDRSLSLGQVFEIGRDLLTAHREVPVVPGDVQCAGALERGPGIPRHHRKTLRDLDYLAYPRHAERVRVIEGRDGPPEHRWVQDRGE